MDIEQLRSFCVSKPFVTESFPFNDDTLVFKVANKMFALISLKRWESQDQFLNLKCNPKRALILREDYRSILPGYHMNKKHWNSVFLNSGELSPDFVKELIDHSYDLVVANLPKREQRQLGFVK